MGAPTGAGMLGTVRERGSALMGGASGVMLACVVGSDEPIECYECESSHDRCFWRIGMVTIFCPRCGSPRDIADVITEYREGM